MGNSNGAADRTGQETWQRVDSFVCRFEEAWRAGGKPDLSAFLPGGGSDRRKVLIELAHIDLERRLKAGEPARVEDYLRRYPELASDTETALALIVAEYRQRLRREPDLAVAEYLGRFPQYGLALAERLSRDCPEGRKGDANRLTLADALRLSRGEESSRTRPEGPTLVPPGAGPPKMAQTELDLAGLLAPAEGAGELGRLGPYRVLRVLGAGGMGVVFHAEDLHLQRAVALKAMLPALAASPSARQRFLREARAAAALKHDHIVSIYQVGEDRGAPYLAMELLEGETLDERLRRDPVLPVPEALRIGRQAALALAAAHKRGLMHRDIKPANLWLDAETGRVKVIDFGLARSDDDEHLTQQGALVGTPAYMAPEQARGQEVGPRCDLFSLGCVLYRMCTGQLPFWGTGVTSTLLEVALHQPPPPAQVNPAVPAGLSELVMRLLAKDADHRPASAGEVAEALRILEVNQTGPKDGGADTVSLLPAAPAAAGARDGRRRKRMVLAVGLLALLLGGVWLAAILHRVETANGTLIVELILYASKTGSSSKV